MKAKYIFFISVFGLLIVFLIWFGYNFAPGSYPYAEIYELNKTESDVVNAIKIIKEENPQLNVPQQMGLIDGRSRDPRDYWYHVYFFYPEEGQIVNTWVKGIVFKNEKTQLAFVSLNEGLTIGKWKRINQDFSRSENKEHKRKFEERILNKVETKLGVKHNWKWW